MYYFKSESGNVYAYDDQQVAMGLAADKTQMTPEEVEAHVNPPVPPKTIEQIILDYTAALEAVYDAKARERRYDSRMTCALRAGYPGPFQAEGQAFAIWMDTCNAHAYEVMADVQAGEREMPTAEELIAEMPELTWPA